MTTEELFDKYKEHVSLSEGQYDYLIDKEDFKKSLVEFAKYHVELALKEAVGTLDDTQLFYLSSGAIRLKEAHKDIVDSYPLENIK